MWLVPDLGFFLKWECPKGGEDGGGLFSLSSPLCHIRFPAPYKPQLALALGKLCKTPKEEMWDWGKGRFEKGGAEVRGRGREGVWWRKIEN